MLEAMIRDHQKDRDILLMTHLVLGYPSFEDNYKTIQAMAEASVELIELQIPFSEPTADGPVILKANSESLNNGTTVQQCLEFAEKVCGEFPEVSFLFMTYYNILFVYGEFDFQLKSREIGIKGFIIPDLPPEEAGDWLVGCKKNELTSIFIFTPTHTEKRLKEIADVSEGFVYCVGRRGVTGTSTDFDQSVLDQIAVYRKATKLPLALGFGVQDKSDVDFLTGKVDIAVIGSKLIKVYNQSGSDGVREFLKSIRSMTN